MNQATNKNKTAIIIGAGPAGLTAAYELIDKTDIKPIIFEATGDIGGISKTINYKGNRIDIGGHRFFSKSDRVMKWWQNILPLPGAPAKDDILLNRQVPTYKKTQMKSIREQDQKEIDCPDPQKDDNVMLIRNRISRIFFLRKFFNYPVSLSKEMILNLGLWRIFKIGLGYLKVKFFPIKKEKNLEDFFINRFGKELYLTFFKDYTEKVWGVPCSQIKPEWGAQRIKGLSISKAILHAIKNIFIKDLSVSQKNTETSLIEQFMYPKLGPGQLWEEVAKKIVGNGGEVHLNQKGIKFNSKDNRIESVTIEDQTNGTQKEIMGDYFFSTMPIKDLIAGMNPIAPESIREVAQGLIYRDFITIGLLLSQLNVQNNSKIKSLNNLIPDNWIYIQERDVKLGRLQIFNNWSPYLVKDDKNVWLGLEYFCSEGDELWSKDEQDFSNFAIEELVRIGIIRKEDVLDSTLIKMPKTYPAYFGTYDRLDEIKDFVNGFENLFLIGRNGMHRYNNQDHSMLTAMLAVENIIHGVKNKENLWEVNTEKEYHEEK